MRIKIASLILGAFKKKGVERTREDPYFILHGLAKAII